MGVLAQLSVFKGPLKQTQAKGHVLNRGSQQTAYATKGCPRTVFQSLKNVIFPSIS